MDNSASNSSVQMPPAPPVPQENSSKSMRNTLLLIGSIFVFVIIVGITLYLMVQNQQSILSLNNTDEMSESNQANKLDELRVQVTPVVSMTPEETLEKFGVFCRRYASLEEALAEAQVACELDLSGQGVSSLPNEISQLKNLSSVNLSGNNLSSFPTVLYELPKLISIDLSDNNLESVPNDIKERIKDLQILNLENNNLPDEIVQSYSQSNLLNNPTR